MTAQRAKRVLSILGAFAVALGGMAILVMSTSTSGGRTVTAQFEKVTGLVTHSEVTYMGAKVGEVSDITYSEDGEAAVITFAIYKDMSLREDASLEIKIKSLLGEQYVELEPGVSAKGLQGDEILDTASDLSMDDLLHTISGLLGDISDSGQIARLVEDISTTFEGRGKDLEVILDDSRIMLQSLTDRSEVLARILTNLDTLTSGLSGKEASIGSMLGSLSETLLKLRDTLAKNVDTLRNTIATLHKTLDSVQIDKVDQASKEIPLWLTKFDHLFMELEGLVSGTKPIASYFVSLPDSSTGLDGAFASMAKIPWLREQLIATLKDAVAA